MAITPQLEQLLHELLAEREIHKVLTRYCRGVDRCDLELLESCFHDDAIDDHGNWVLQATEATADIIRRVKPGPDAAMHFLGNVHIEVEGETAFAESYLLAFRTAHREERAYTRTRAIRFIDRFTLRNNEWRISERVVVDDWNRIDEIVQSMPDSPLFRYSSKDRHDPVYAIREGRVAREPGAV